MVASAALTESATAVDVQPTDITVNLDQSTGPVEYGVTGFLYGLADDGVPTDTMVQGLGHLHTQVGRPTDGKQHPNGDCIQTANQWFRNGGQYIQIYLKDAYELTYTVSDSAGATATVKRLVTVKYKAGNGIKPGAGDQGDAAGSDNGADGASKDAIGNTGAAVGVIAIAAIVLTAVGAVLMYRRRRA